MLLQLVDYFQVFFYSQCCCIFDQLFKYEKVSPMSSPKGEWGLQRLAEKYSHNCRHYGIPTGQDCVC